MEKNLILHEAYYSRSSSLAHPTFERDKNSVLIKDDEGNYIPDNLVKRRVAVSGSDIEFAQDSQAQLGTTEITLNKKEHKT